MSLVILIPVLRRPHRIAPLLGSINETTTVEHRTLFIASPSDTAEISALEKEGADYAVIDDDYEGRGDYARKINHGHQVTTEPYIFLGADDLEFHPQWFEKAVVHMKGRVGVVGTNDMGNYRVISGTHSTHSLVSREYADECGTIDEDGKILHEGYSHNFVDDELIQTALRRRACVFARDSIVVHLHPNWGSAPPDEVYDLGGRDFQKDSVLFRGRARLWGR